MPPISLPTSSTSLTITNPLILYRSLLATKAIDPDPSQHRLALHLQKLYNRLKDYTPKEEYSARLKAVSSALAQNEPRPDLGGDVAVPGHPLRRNPLFAHIFKTKVESDTKALTRVLTSHEAAMELQSPQGLLLHGEVGTGKSMLLDLLADSLPNKKKARWHFNTFMLDSIAKLEALRHARLKDGNASETEYSLLWLAKDLVEKSPILFLDEFQLPDRAASKILSNLLTTFFQLGGVLIASSNRIPDELAKASGVEFAPPPRSGLVRNIFGLGAGRKGYSGLADPGKGEFASFLDVLKARCEVWEMEGGKDWRRREAEVPLNEEEIETLREEIIDGFSGLGQLQLSNHERQQSPSDVEESKISTDMIAPRKYLISNLDSEDTWDAVIQRSFPPETPSPIPWKEMTVLVYGRTVAIPKEYSGTAFWDFQILCGGAFGPADYITIASTFHTIILDHVPILTSLQKNEARRLITLLDALYEARCKLLIRAEAGPDNLFFPELQRKPSNPLDPNAENENANSDDAVYPETLSEIYQDQTSPFRPNISSYEASTEGPTPRGFDPDEALDTDPKTGLPINPLDFGQTSAFVGEDEKFAYKRARSRLWEMCGTKWHARDGEGWWKPLPVEVRRWERSRSAENDITSDQEVKELRRHPITGAIIQGDVKMGGFVELDMPAGLQGKELEAEKMGLLKGKENPWLKEKEADKIEPKMGWTPWGMVSWARKGMK